MQDTDTIQYELYGLNEGSYQFRFAMQLIDASGLQAYLVDRYLNKETPVSLLDSTHIDFDINAAPASSMPFRFFIMFKRVAAPFKFVTNNAKWNNDGTANVTWSVANYDDIIQFLLQKSDHLVDFNNLSDPVITNGNSYSIMDPVPSVPYTYYRVKATASNGVITYSDTIKLFKNTAGPKIIITPNPVENKLIQLQVENLASGNYSWQLWNAGGSLINKGGIVISGTKSLHTINLQHHLPAGSYNIKLSDQQGRFISSATAIIR